MRRKIAYPLAALFVSAGTLAVATPALAHGYVSSPPSRQALCASGAVSSCGPIQFEPQSVEGPKGLRSCDGGLSQFSVLADDARNWPAKSVESKVTFSWVLTARHRTSTWDYFIGRTKVASFDDGGAQPAAVVNHSLDLSRFPGRQKVLAVWNIADTGNAFYNCVDLQVGGGGGSTPTTPPTKPPATSPTKAPTTPATKPPAAGSGKAWAAGTSYKTGDVVTFQGKKYQCRQSHSSINSWEPPIYTLALWLPL
ncbi:lytic polysaccharide monooxygenase [Actinoplanes solisilvae]|uniref:lytic polysaccharide monooxygenase n=1 Tax=Actinoplanes solisilvae TaxID=2486853 RepID=UPI001F0BEDB9|nr:lytic polysaccharide monooxygenase [Actinoplanes solisilvae]